MQPHSKERSRSGSLRTLSGTSSKYAPHTSGYSPPEGYPPPVLGHPPPALGFVPEERKSDSWSRMPKTTQTRPVQVTNMQLVVKRLKNAFRFGKLFKSRPDEPKAITEKETDNNKPNITNKPIIIASEDDLRGSNKASSSEKKGDSKHKENSDLKNIYEEISIKDSLDSNYQSCSKGINDRGQTGPPIIQEPRKLGETTIKIRQDSLEFEEARIRVKHDLERVFKGLSIVSASEELKPKEQQTVINDYDKVFGKQTPQIVERVSLTNVGFNLASKCGLTSNICKETENLTPFEKSVDQKDSMNDVMKIEVVLDDDDLDEEKDNSNRNRTDEDIWPGHSFAVQSIINDYEYLGKQ